MRVAKVIKGAGLREGVLINEIRIIESARLTVRIIRGTELSIDRARIAAGDAMAVTMPGPPDGITDGDIYFGRRKRETIQPYRDVEDLAATRWHAADHWPTVLIYNPDGVSGDVVELCCRDVSVAGCSLRRKYHRKHHRQAKRQWYYCVRSFHGLTPSSVRQCLRISFHRNRIAANALRFRRQARYCLGSSKKRKQNPFCPRTGRSKSPQKK